MELDLNVWSSFLRFLLTENSQRLWYLCREFRIGPLVNNLWPLCNSVLRFALPGHERRHCLSVRCHPKSPRCSSWGSFLLQRTLFLLSCEDWKASEVATVLLINTLTVKRGCNPTRPPTSPSNLHARCSVKLFLTWIWLPKKEDLSWLFRNPGALP